MSLGRDDHKLQRREVPAGGLTRRDAQPEAQRGARRDAIRVRARDLDRRGGHRVQRRCVVCRAGAGRRPCGNAVDAHVAQARTEHRAALVPVLDAVGVIIDRDASKAQHDQIVGAVGALVGARDHVDTLVTVEHDLSGIVVASVRTRERAVAIERPVRRTVGEHASNLDVSRVRRCIAVHHQDPSLGGERISTSAATALDARVSHPSPMNATSHAPAGVRRP